MSFNRNFVLFLMMSFMLGILKMNFLALEYFIIVFLAEYIIPIFINPKYSPMLIVGRLIRTLLRNPLRSITQAIESNSKGVHYIHYTI